MLTPINYFIQSNNYLQGSRSLASWTGRSRNITSHGVPACADDVNVTSGQRCQLMVCVPFHTLLRKKRWASPLCPFIISRWKTSEKNVVDFKLSKFKTEYVNPDMILITKPCHVTGKTESNDFFFDKGKKLAFQKVENSWD